MIVALSISGNLSKYFDDSSSYQTDLDLIPLASLIVFATGLGVPILLSFFVKKFGSDVTFFQVFLKS
jgi:hypothetical protein